MKKKKIGAEKIYEEMMKRQEKVKTFQSELSPQARGGIYIFQEKIQEKWLMRVTHFSYMKSEKGILKKKNKERKKKKERQQ